MPVLSRIGVAVFVMACASAAMAQLKAGSIAFIACNTDGYDEFSWVALQKIPAQTTLCFTDASVSNGWFRWTEHLGDVVMPGPLRWVHSHDVPAGTVVRWNGSVLRTWSLGEASGGYPSLSQDGDQLTAYVGTIIRNTELPYPWQGDPSGATLLHALTIANDGWDDVHGGATETSYVPPGLSVEAGTAVHASRLDNAYYDGIREGAADDLLAAIAEPGNWVASNAVFAAAAWTGAETLAIKPAGSVYAFK